MIDLTCPHCNTYLKIPDQYAGQSGKCDHCGGAITIGVLPPPLPRKSRGHLVGWAAVVLLFCVVVFGAKSLYWWFSASYYIEMGDSYWREGDLEQAEHAYQTALEFAGEDTEQQAFAYQGLGWVHVGRNDYDKAEEHFRKTLAAFDKLGNKEGMARQNGLLAMVYGRRGEPKKVLPLALKAVELDPTEPMHLETLALAYRGVERFDEAIETVDRLIDAGPESWHLFDLRGHLNQSFARRSNAAADYSRAIQLRPNDAHLYNDLAWLYVSGTAQQNEPDEALSLALKAIELEPGNGAYLNTLGVVYYRLREFDQGIETLNRSVEAHAEGGSAFDLFFLAMCHHELGRRDRAKEYHDEAVRLWDSQKPLSPELTAIRAEADALFKE